MIHIAWALVFCLFLCPPLHGLPTQPTPPNQTDAAKTHQVGHSESQSSNNQSGVRDLLRYCSKGQFFNAFESKCVACPEGEFMPLEIHSMHKCWTCASNDTKGLPNSKIIQQCNSTHPTLLVCKEGYYVKPSTEEGKGTFGECLPCRVCNSSHVGRESQDEHDTVCCPQPNKDVVDTEDGPHSHTGESKRNVPVPDVTNYTLTFPQPTCPTCLQKTKCKDEIKEGPFKILFAIFFAASFFMTMFLVVTYVIKWKRKRHKHQRKKTTTTTVELDNTDEDEHIYSRVIN